MKNIIEDLIKENYLYKIPESLQPLIEEDKQFALLVWDNFKVDLDYYEEFDLSDWYKAGNWKWILGNYINDFEFWEIAIQKFDYKLLLEENFKKDFPLVTHYFLSNNDKLLKILKKTSNKEFYHLLTLDEEQLEEINKDFLINNSSYIPQEEFNKYQSGTKQDIHFIKKMLKKSANNYFSLNDENKQNPEFIRLCLKEKNVFFSIPEQLKDLFFIDWLIEHREAIKIKDLSLLSKKQSDRVLEERPDMILDLINADKKSYFPYAVKLLEQDFDKYIKTLNLEKFKEIWGNHHIEKLYPLLENYVNNFNKFELSKIDSMYIHLIQKDEKLSKLLADNVLYKISTSLNTKQNISHKTFIDYYKILSESFDKGELEEGTIEGLLNKVRLRLSIPDLKEHKYPKKDLFRYMKAKTLSENLSNNLEIKEDAKNRLKI